MQELITEIKLSISHHKNSAKSINRAMWILIVLAISLYFLIYVMLDIQIKNIARIVEFSLQYGVKSFDSSPTSIASASNSTPLGAIVLGMCAARLLVYFGQLRFHLKEVSSYQHMLIAVLKVQAANHSELNESTREALIYSSTCLKEKNDPSLYIPAEAIKKISNAVTDRISKLLKS